MICEDGEDGMSYVGFEKGLAVKNRGGSRRVIYSSFRVM